MKRLRDPNAHERIAPLTSVVVWPVNTTRDRIAEAVVLGDTSTAVAAWREAYAAALRGGQWRDLIDVGDVAFRIGDIPEFGETAQGAARKSYLTALYRAESQQSVDGVLMAAERFAALNDRAGVQHGVVIAYRIAGANSEVRARVLTFTERFTAVAGGTERADM